MTPNLSKRVFSVRNRESKNHYWNLFIQITLGTKFQLKITHFLDQICPIAIYSGPIGKCFY